MKKIFRTLRLTPTFRQGQVDTIYQSAMISSDRYIKRWGEETTQLNKSYNIIELKNKLNTIENKNELKSIRQEIEKIRNSNNYINDIEKIKSN